MPKSSTVWLRLAAASVFTAIPAIALPVFIHHLYAVRPHVTDARGGFVLPHYRDGVAWYFAHSDEMLIRGLSLWLLAAVLLLMFVGGQVIRRRLKQWLKPPVTVDTDDETARPV
jgi:succinate dehydrogenase/fumarate reductase cytochrome b subunit